MRVERLIRLPLGVALLLASAAVLAQAVYRLDRASIDGAGGGVAEGISYRAILAFGQHDADAVAGNGSYRYVGGVFAQVPGDRVFRDSFEFEAP